MSENQETVQGSEKNFIAKWIGVYFSPAETFASIDKKPDWFLPLLVLALISVVSVLLIAPELQNQQVQMAIDRGMSEDEAYDSIGASSAFMKYLLPVFSVVGVFILTFILAGIFYVLFNFMMGGDSTYKKVLSVYCYIGLAVGSVGTIVMTPLIKLKGSMDVQTSFAAFLSSDMKDQFLYKLLAKFDIFTIWQVVLLIIGLGVIYKYSRGKAATGVLVLWGIWIVVSIVLGNIFSGLTG